MGQRRPKKKPLSEGQTADSRRKRESEVEALVMAHAEPLCLSEGLELVAVEYKREPGGRVLRIFIDGPNGVGLEDCSRISRQLGDVLDIYLEDLGPHNLEVSSPGAERPLMKPSDFERFAGHKVKIRIGKPMVGSQRNYTGLLEGLAEGRARLNVDGEMVEIALDNITKARLVVDFKF